MKREDGVKLNKRSADGKIAYLIKPILKVLQDAGGQLERSEIKERIADLDDQIAEYAEKVTISKKKGNPYKKFNFQFNFAVKDLFFNGLVTSSRSSPVVLTEKGENLDIDTLDVWKIIEASKTHWEELKRNNKNKNFDIDDSEEESDAEDKLIEEFDERLLAAIAKMSPKKFEAFSRALLTKMGVEFDSVKGVQVSNDGGIDGYGYHVDSSDFRTTRVVIQCKRYNNGKPVSEKEINEFLGAMNKYQADYGVFITSSRFTNAARTAAKEGSPITLIDGSKLVDLIKRYELGVKQVKTYVLLDEFYNSNE